MNTGELNPYIERARNKDNDAIEQLIKITQNKLFFVVLSFVKKDADAQDVLQNSYIKAFSTLDSLKDDSKFEAWITRIVSNTALDHMKRASAKYDVKFTDLANGEDELPFDTADERIEFQPELSLSQKETQRIVKEIIDSLSDEQRVAVMMYFYDGMTTKEIAEEIGCKEVTVKARIRYAKEKIKESVDTIQKRDGIKLYNLAPLSFFLLLLRNYSMSGFGLSTLAGAGATAGSVAAASSVGTGATSVVTKATVSTGIKAFLGSTVGKAAIVGAIAVAGGVAITTFNNAEKVVSFETNETTKTYYDGTEKTIVYEYYYFYDQNGEPLKRAVVIDGQITVTDIKANKDEDGNAVSYMCSRHAGELITETRIVTTEIDDDHSTKYVYCKILPEYYDDYKCSLTANNEVLTYEYGQLMMEVRYYKNYAVGVTVYNSDETVSMEKNSNVSEGTDWSIADDYQYNDDFGAISPGKGFNVTASRNDSTETVTFTDVCVTSSASGDAKDNAQCLKYSSGNTVNQYKNDEIINSKTNYTFEYVNGYSYTAEDGLIAMSENNSYEYSSVRQANSLFEKILEEYGYDAAATTTPNDNETEQETSPEEEQATATKLSNEEILKAFEQRGYIPYTDAASAGCSFWLRTNDYTEQFFFSHCDSPYGSNGWSYLAEKGEIEKSENGLIFFDCVNREHLDLNSEQYFQGKYVSVLIGDCGSDIGYEPTKLSDEEYLEKGKEFYQELEELLNDIGITDDELYEFSQTYNFEN